MTPVSRRKLPTEAEGKIRDIFTTELVKITDKKELESLMSLLLSDSERLMLSKRLAAFVMIEKQVPDTTISRALNLTTVTVAKLRFAYLLSKQKQEPAAKIIQNPKLSKILTELFKRVLVNYALPAMGGRIPRDVSDMFKPVRERK